MKLTTKTFIGAAAATLMMATSANALEAVGNVASVSGDVVIERNGEFLRAGEQSALIAGDRIVTTNGSAVLAAEGCANTSIEAGSVVLVGANLCESATKVAEMNASDAAASAPIASMNLASASPIVLVLAAAAAVIGIAAIASDGDDDVTSP